ncbi:Fe-S cluster assembly protein HesB [Phytoactinopolyspora alkaliphila]|uniref:Fe-S cluster assembly protein HesB n=1 Tax=Phytoactinopolyspora alkaliphila TaxID=1783498 RepID=A0A6N9YRI0_9ACTN|nr:Fe-S cluster assembly protein HesB [Phytoactinopolyspora alkaliphila]
MMTRLHLAGDPAADALLERDPFALLVGMLLDQQIPMEWAFAGPATIAERLGVDTLDPVAIAGHEAESFAALMAQKPAVHRFPGSMAGRVQALAAHVAEHWGGDASAIWRDATSGAELLKRVKALPGYGDQKARILVALLGKQFDVRPDGWRQAAGAYGEDGSTRSIADVVDAETLAQVRAFKREAKQKQRSRG